MGENDISRFWWAAIATALCVFASACTSTPTSRATGATNGTLKPVDGGSLVIGTSTDATGWNPQRSEWDQSASLVASSVLEPLAEVGTDNGAKPWLAESWIANSAFDRWEIKLRAGVRFQDGEPFNAATVKENLDEAVRAPISGQALGSLFKAVSVVDDHTVLVQLTQPWAAFPSSFLDGQSALMMAPAMLRSPDHGATHPIGTGPFTFVSWQPGVAFHTRKNPTYWRKGLPHLSALEFRTITDAGTQANALQAGDVDLILTASAPIANQLRSSYTVVRDWDTDPVNLVLNTVPSIHGTTNPLANHHAREALALATDRRVVAASIGVGVKSPSSPFSPSSPWGMPESQDNYPTFNLDQARREVAAYKHDSGQKSLHFALMGLADVDSTRLLQLLQAQWAEAGIHVDIVTGGETSLVTNLVGGTFNAAVVQLYSSPDPDQDNYFWSADTISGVGGVNINMAQYSTPRIQADLNSGRTSGYPKVRKAAYDDLVRQINAAATNIWLYWTPFSLIASRKVHGLETASQVPFGNFQPKTWLADLWRE